MEYMQSALRNTQTNRDWRERTPEATNRRDRGLTVKKPGTGLTARSGGLTVRTIKARRMLYTIFYVCSVSIEKCLIACNIY